MLREPTFLILTALAERPLHGYGIVAEVAGLSGGRVTLRPGTLYGALDRLAEDGLVVLDSEEVVDGRLRRYYRLTDEGVSVLRAETERMRLHVRAATRRLRGRGDAGLAGGAALAGGAWFAGGATLAGGAALARRAGLAGGAA